jgi:predicted nucleotide-binding protein (sugar kinase/HSP70/actin superfamily)
MALPQEREYIFHKNHIALQKPLVFFTEVHTTWTSWCRRIRFALSKDHHKKIIMEGDNYLTVLKSNHEIPWFLRMCQLLAVLKSSPQKKPNISNGCSQVHTTLRSWYRCASAGLHWTKTSHKKIIMVGDNYLTVLKSNHKISWFLPMCQLAVLKSSPQNFI